MNKCIDTQQQDLRMLTDSVSMLHNQVQSQSHALIAMQNLSLLLEQKNTVDMSILYKSIIYNMMTDEQKEVTRLQVKELEGQKEKLDKNVKKMRGMVRGLTTPSLPPPPQVNTPQAGIRYQIPTLSYQTPVLC